jgi:predicted HAD superfamily Cof-like phosphohydrolase
MSMVAQVIEFNKAFEVALHQEMLYANLIEEEYEEWVEEHYINDNPENELKEICDMMYVILGYAIQKGWNLEEAFRRVHESNMTKLVNGKPLRNATGKVVKGPNYRKPNLKDLV